MSCGETSKANIHRCIFGNGLTALTVLSLLAATTRSAGSPDPLLAPHDPDAGAAVANDPRRLHSSSHSGDDHKNGRDDDDIPLRFLKNPQWVTTRAHKDRPSPLPLGTHRSRRRLSEGLSGGNTPSDEGPSSAEVGVTPFPLAISPFVPQSTAEAGESDEDSGDSPPYRYQSESPAVLRVANEDEEDDDGHAADTARLLADPGAPANRHYGHAPHHHAYPKPAGKSRWCSKCSGWKPDRTHHCRYCARCVLKMDHHCVWLGTCVGFGNYRPFLLFITYGTLMAVYISLESAYSVYQFFTDPPALRGVSKEMLAQAEEYLKQKGGAGAAGSAAARAVYTVNTTAPGITYSPGDVVSRIATTAGTAFADLTQEIDIAPVVMLLLAVSGAFFALSVGTLAGYHWYLACNNLTTLEHMTHTYPHWLMSALDGSAPPQPESQSEPPSVPFASADDHLLSRSDRHRLRRQARDLNVWDLGWRRNLRTLFIGPVGSLQDPTGPVRVLDVLLGLWPLSKVEKRFGISASATVAAGHEFVYDDVKLDRLRWITNELRLGVRKEERIGPYEGEGIVHCPREHDRAYDGDDDDYSDDSDD